MKFRDFVGDREIVIKPKKKKEKKKKIIEEIKDDTQYYFGYGLSKIQLKKFFDYFRSWFVRYNINFESINPILMLYVLSNVPHRNKFINIINEIKKPKIYPLGTIEFYNDLNNELLIDYVMNKKFEKSIDDAFSQNNIDIIDKSCYVSILEFEDINQRMMEDMSYSMPRIPYLVLGNPVLIRS